MESDLRMQKHFQFAGGGAEVGRGKIVYCGV